MLYYWRGFDRANFLWKANMARDYYGMTFPEYEFREYPKVVGDKRYLSKEEELADIAAVQNEKKLETVKSDSKPTTFAPSKT